MQRIPLLQQKCTHHLRSRTFFYGDSCLHRRLVILYGTQLHTHWGRHLRQVACAAQTVPKTSPEVANMPWTNSPQQQQALAALRTQTQNLPGGQPDEETLRWFLRDRSFNLEEAVGKLQKMTAWRRKFRPDVLSEEDVLLQLSSGKGYLHDHLDAAGRPVMVVRVAKHFPGGEGEPLGSRKLCAFLMESALQRLPPGQETVLGIFDFQGAGPQNIDLEFARFLVDMFFTYYPKRLGQVLMVDAPWLFQPPWQLIKPLLKKYATLVRFVSAKDVRNEFFTADKVPEDFKR